jgi:hypothetical protein
VQFAFAVPMKLHAGDLVKRESPHGRWGGRAASCSFGSSRYNRTVDFSHAGNFLRAEWKYLCFSFIAIV